MLKLLKSSHPLILLLIPLISALLSIRVYFAGTEELSVSGYGLVFWGISRSPAIADADLLFAVFFGVFLSVAALLYAHVINRTLLFEKVGYLHAFVFLLLISGFTQNMMWLPVITAGVIILWSLKLLTDALKENEAVFTFFNIGFLIAVASFFYFDALFFAVFVLTVKLFVRSRFPNEWLSFIVGLILPCFLFLIGDFVFAGHIDEIAKVNSFVGRESKLSALEPAVLFLGIISITLIPALVTTVRRTSKMSILIRTYAKVFRMFFIVVLGIFVLITWSDVTLMFFASAALALPLTFFFESKRLYWLRELIFWILSGLGILTQTAPDLILTKNLQTLLF